jgi:hypothetical protein
VEPLHDGPVPGTLFRDERDEDAGGEPNAEGCRRRRETREERSAADMVLARRRWSTPHGRNEPISPARNRLQILRRSRVVLQGNADPADAIVESGVEVHERAVFPERFAKLVAGDELAVPAGQDVQDAGRLIGKPDDALAPRDLAALRIEPERAERSHHLHRSISHSAIWPMPEPRRSASPRR